MKRPLNFVRIVGLVALIVCFVLSCQREAQDDSLQKQVRVQQSIQAAQDNSSMISATQDAVRLTASAFANQGITFGRIADDDGDDPECKPVVTNNIKVDWTHTDSLIVSGTITIDFGDSTVCDSTHMRKGKIIDSIMLVVAFKDRTTFKSSEKITFQNYWRDSTQVDGTISVNAATGSPTIVAINGSRIRYHDGTSSSWTGSLVFIHEKNTTGNTITITGSWSGTTRHGTTFSATITKAIEYKAGCFGHWHRFIQVSGIVEVVTNGVTSTIDYGDGTCDRVYTITTAGVTTEHRLS
jgi:hypothetical protein